MMAAPAVPASMSTSASHMCSTPDQLPHRISVRGPVPEPAENGLSPLTIQALYCGPAVTENRSEAARSYGCCTLYVSVYRRSPAVGPVPPVPGPGGGLCGSPDAPALALGAAEALAEVAADGAVPSPLTSSTP